MGRSAGSSMADIARLLDTFGCWGLVALLISGIVYLYKNELRSHRRELAMAERILPLVEEVRSLAVELKGFLYAMRSERRP